jgi:phosphoheptose isomerase
MTNKIKQAFTENIQTNIEAADTLSDAIARAGAIMVQCLIDGRKILACGNGGSACDAEYFVSLMLDRHERERPSLPAIALTHSAVNITAMANNDSFNDVYAKQVRALGNEGDVLLVFSTSGNSKSCVRAIESALSRDMLIIAITGKDGGTMAGLIGSNDIEVRVPSNSVPRIREVHRLVIHTLADFIDNSLFGEIN